MEYWNKIRVMLRISLSRTVYAFIFVGWGDENYITWGKRAHRVEQVTYLSNFVDFPGLEGETGHSLCVCVFFFLIFFWNYSIAIQYSHMNSTRCPDSSEPWTEAEMFRVSASSVEQLIRSFSRSTVCCV